MMFPVAQISSIIIAMQRVIGVLGVSSKYCGLLTFVIFFISTGVCLGMGGGGGGRVIDSVTLDGAASVTVLPAATISATITVSTTGAGANGRWRSTAWRIAGSPPGATICVDHPNHDTAGTYTETFPITAPAAVGTYNAYFIAYRNDGCSQGASPTETMVDAVTVEPLCSGTFRDEFSSAAFGNNDGASNFSDNWDEYEGTSLTVPEASPDPASGHVRIFGGQLVMNNYSPESANAPGVERELDLSAFTSATFSFDFVTSGGVDNDDSLLVQASANGGATWALLEDITGITNTSGSKNYDLTPYISANTKIRLRFNTNVNVGACCYGGSPETISLDNINIDATGPCPSVDHLRIEHTGVGLTCQRSDVTIRACEDAACNTEYSGAVTFDLLPATGNPPEWIGGDSQSISGGSGAFKLRQTAPTILTLGLANVSPSPANSAVCYLAGSPGSCDIEFFDSGFLFDVPDLTSCQTSPAVSIQAVRTDLTTQTCVADGGFANVSKTVNFWTSYSNPGSGTMQLDLSGTNLATSSPGTGISLNFDATATATFTADYPDAGQLQLDARYEGVGVEEAGLVMLGSDSFTVRPVGLCIYSNDANADCGSGDGSCSEFRKVDENFNLRVKAVCWESGADTDFCSGNATTPNYEQNGITLAHALVAPTSPGSSAGGIAVSSIDLVDADNGEHVITNQSVSEVGVFTFTASPPNYFGAAMPVATSTNIGRFTPDHLLTLITANGSLQDACTGFSYSGQNFSYDPADLPVMTITAVDSGGGTTLNYRDDFVKLTNPATQITMPAVTADASHLGADLVTPLALSWTPAVSSLVKNDDGTLTFTLGTDTFSYTRDANAMVAPVTSDIRLPLTTIADSDGIAATDLPRQFAPAGTEIRYGQLNLQNAYGSETLPLSLTLTAEHYTGTGFVTNPLDSCTPYNDVNLGLSNHQAPLGIGDTDPAGSGLQTLSAGFGTGMSLTAPGAGKHGSVDLTLDLAQPTGAEANLLWLQPAGVNPTAKATFGIYKGNDRLIYMRESVQ